MNHELATAARAFGASTHVDAFGELIRPALSGNTGITYRRNDLDIAFELLRKLPSGSIRISCGKNMKFSVMLDENTTLGEYPDLARAALALVELMTTLEARVAAARVA